MTKLSDQKVSRLNGLAAAIMNSINWVFGDTRPCAEGPSYQLDAFCNRSLQWIMGYSWQDHMSDQQLYSEHSTRPVPHITPGKGDMWNKLGSHGLVKLIRSTVGSYIWAETWWMQRVDAAKHPHWHYFLLNDWLIFYNL